MTNEQLTEKVIELVAYKEKAQEEHETFKSTLSRLQDNMVTFTKLAEDVHIMAINMKNMQKTLEETSRKVDALSSKEFTEYKETKKMLKQNVLNKIVGGIVGAVMTGIVWFITTYFAG